EPGSGDYGALSVGVQIRARPGVAFGVSRQAFRPRPEVESVTVVLEPRGDRPGRGGEEAVRRLTRACFSRRRKQLQKILRSAPEYGLGKGEARELCRDLGLDPRVRPEKVAPDTFLRLADRLEG
ncbi:MAG: rRNA adenine N-6-methyltransferase family protein, partial [Gemmatimonadota bacterium]